MSWVPLLYPHPIYCANPLAIGQNSIEMAPMNVPFAGQYYMNIVVQDHGPLNFFLSANMSWSNNKDGGGYVQFGKSQVIRPLGRGWYNLNPVVYDMKLEYSYANNDNEPLQVRWYSGKAPVDWLPYCD
ncbi:DUF7154 domain-containing protein [Caenorhabditis elegans]|uniref:DUF7154 domain-containing protein n=1 Tax=Caenorhabditis elegans TaxID=6239 RepID=A4F309_CAEEL|nr:PA14 domain-containing protein [Caenorhabditis elegans]CCD63951.1 PA14 domain-containing protein [Caenorhabditis elegans]|eukprot:NP_741308.2 Uncharacterized protein CELE_F38A1.6 [Caenorhabditis elegans]